MGRQCTRRALGVLAVLLSAVTLLAGAGPASLAEMMQRIGDQWERIAGGVLFDRGEAMGSITQLVGTMDDLRTYTRLNTDMQGWLAETREALLSLEDFLRQERREEAWAQRTTVERLCEHCHQEYRLADIMRRLMDEYNQVADAFVRGRYERVVHGMHVFQGQTEWYRRWISATETMFHEEAQRLLDLARRVAEAAAARDRPRTQHLLQQLIDSCPPCHTAYRDTGRWRELTKRY